VLKTVIIFCCLLTARAASADTLNTENLKVYGRALANYQLCTQIAGELGDKIMLSYYAEMFNDRSAEINAYPERLSAFIYQEFKRSEEQLAKIDRQSMGLLCLSRFDLLSRKMQEKKLAGKQTPLKNNGIYSSD